MWHDGGHSFCGCGWAPVRWFLCLFRRKTHKKRLCARFPTRLEENKERQGLRAVNREELATISEKWRSERGGRLSEELGLVDPEARSASARRWVSVPGSCVGISFEYTLVIATECQKSAKTSLFLRLGLTQVHACLFFLPLSVISVIYL